jgi:transposase
MEEFIGKENSVRFVDAFVEQLELDELGFEIATLKTEGRSAFNPKVFLKLYFYGYLNGLRSSRKLEKEAIGK